MASRDPEMMYQLHIQLAEIEPPIWRRILVSGSLTLRELHHVLQVVMGWEHSHLHQFIVGDRFYGEPDPDFGDRLRNNRRVSLRTIAKKVGMRFVYEYDFGDSWQHLITVEEIKPFTEEMEAPLRCLDGARACPPEDCGGVGGYEELVQALKDRSHPAHREMRLWVGKHYQPELFSLQAVNSALGLLVALSMEGR